MREKTRTSGKLGIRVRRDGMDDSPRHSDAFLILPGLHVQGHGGGVYIADGYRLGKKYFSQKQSEFLERIAEGLTGEDLEMMKGILKIFKEPKRGNK